MQTTESSVKSPSVLSVEQLNKQIRNLLELNIGTVWVKGEISNFKPHASGHWYFSLKDASSQISAVMFKGQNSKMRFKVQDGLEVIAKGKITSYEPRGTYQILCEFLEPVGAGALQKAFEQLKEKLAAEGLFDASRKRALPMFPKQIAVVTSPTGAAIKDILNIIKRRNKSVAVTVIPTQVQGATAAQQIVESLDQAYKVKNFDVIIVGRGGGSIEDLWCFNEESVARKIAQSPVPIVSAVGHEIDFTIADFVADLRAPTPSAAAELVTKDTVELQNRLLQLQRVMISSIQKKFLSFSEKLHGLRKRLLDPRKKIQDLILRNDELFERLHLAVKNAFTFKKLKLQKLMALLDTLSPLKVLDRGFSITKKNDELITRLNQVEVNETIQVVLAQGELIATVTERREHGFRKKFEST